MKIPPQQTLCETMDLDLDDYRIVAGLANRADDPEALRAWIERYCELTHSYARSCYRDPYDSPMWRRTLVLHALDAMCGTHGVETIGGDDDDFRTPPPFEYLNAGDTYATTLIFDRGKDEITIGCWGDLVESGAV